jgi:enoyl-CoA hydratase/carnithine racemase
MEAFGSAPLTQADAVYIEIHREIAELVLNRPEVLNAENWAMAHAFHRALDQFEKNRETRAVIVRGAGSSFSSGVDLNALSAGELGVDWFRAFDEAMRRLEQLDCLTVAKIRGYAIGGGLQIALACDLRIASEDAKLGLPAVKEALIPGMGTYRLPRFIGLGRARRMVLTGELIGADEANRIGLLDWIVPAEQLDDKVREVISTVLKGSSVAQAFSKKLVTRAFESNFNDSLSLYLEFQKVALDSEDHRRAMADYRADKETR